MSEAGGADDSFREEGSQLEEEDRELSGNSGSKKKYVYRRDVQRRYRERLKQKRQVTEVGLERTRRSIALVTSSNRSLREIQNALELLNDDGCRLLSILSVAQAQQVVSAANMPPPDPFDAADYFIQLAFSGETTTFDEMLMKKYTSFPLSILQRKEQDFMNRLQGLMNEWTVCLSSRDRLEKCMASALMYRRRAAVFLSMYAPESHIALMKNIQPARGNDNGIGDAAYQLLVSVVDGLDLSPKQVSEIERARREYQQAVACVRTEMALAQLALCMTPGATPPAEHELRAPSGGVPGVMSTRAQGLLACRESAVILDRVPYKLVHAYARLANAVLTPLSTVQNAKLILECRPYLPDHVQLCEIVCEMYSQPY